MKMPSSSLWSAFKDGQRFAKGGDIVEMTCRDVGVLVLPTGRLVACDPQFDLAAAPFKTRVEPGEYPLFLSLAYGGVALVMIQFREGQPDRWVAGSPRRCNVDSATACVMDAKLCRCLARKSEAGKWERYWKRIDDAMVENDGRWGNVCLHEGSGANMLVFQTYGGDGAYATYWGYSGTGDLICSVMDLFLEDGVEAI